MSEANAKLLALVILVVVVVCFVPVGLWLGRRVNRRLGLRIPDDGGPIRKKMMALALLLATIWGTIWLTSGFGDPFDFAIPVVFSAVSIFVIFRGLTRS
jgi:hypothetical protein